MRVCSVPGLSLFAPIFLCAALSVGPMSCGAKDPHNPGEGVGIYHLTADVDLTSSCTEAAAAAPRPWEFDVTLRREGTTGFWISGAEPLEGIVDAKGTLSFRVSTKVTMRRADKARELGACVIVRTDDFSGALAGAPTSETGIASFTGTLRYAYSVDAGSDCRDLVGPVGEGRTNPVFGALPCDVRFAVKATRSGPAKE